MKSTKRKLALLNTFEHSSKPLSIQQAWQKVSAVSMSLSTAYRLVTSLHEEGKLAPIPIHRNPPLWISLQSNQHHFFCQKCGGCYPVSCDLSELNSDIPQGFQTNQHYLALVGRCRDCH